MTDHITPQQFVRIAVMAFLAFAAVVAVIHSRRGEDAGIIAPLEHEQADALASELARCRTITADEAIALDSCRRAWAENRQHFFAPVKPIRIPAEPIPSAVTGPAKSQDRVTPFEVQSEKR
ncbi:conjugative transfer region protein TrbK [Bradyrhizobium lablabi]|uniref:Conjugative transfer region protein TrbK n=1 Tax=Bradyrhizobium lablabi TaxID=722472 RepID=A0A1M6NIA5_9BRAD|nr:putative entry exclusion protein TrbK-alt [Bradyrhizobium lablabi]SHJ95354.1 conjugative transfer region protein TrbK [Bradyrhizobium lablabi]